MYFVAVKPVKQAIGVPAVSRAASNATLERLREDACVIIEATDSTGTAATTSSVAYADIESTAFAHRNIVVSCTAVTAMLSVTACCMRDTSSPACGPRPHLKLLVYEALSY